MDEQFSFKELYECQIKALEPIHLSGRDVEAGETVAYFDRVQSATFNPMRKVSTANGGFDNRPLVWWENSTGAQVYLSQGIFSTQQLEIMTNSRVYHHTPVTPLMVPIREELESNENGKILLKEKVYTPTFVYNKSTGAKVAFTVTGDKELTIADHYLDVVVDYYMNYSKNWEILTIGKQVENKYFDLTAKTRVKDDITGKERTGLIHIPKLKLLTDISVRLGKQGTPLTEHIAATACPTGSKGNTTVMELYFLEDDIDSDI